MGGLLVVFGVILCLIGIALLALVVFVVCAVHQMEKLTFGLPLLKWLTLEETVAMGFSRFWCKAILPSLYELGCLEIRLHEIDVDALPETLRTEEIRGHLSEVNRLLDGVEFNFDTVEIHDFRLTKRGGRRRFRFKLPKILSPRWQPQPI